MAIQLKPAESSPLPFSWDNLPTSPAPASPKETSPSTEPATVWLSARDMKLYGAQPLATTSSIGVAKCKDCSKPILQSCMAEHADNCAKISKVYKKNGEGSKKRKAPASPAEASGPSKKKSKTTKSAPRRPKGPVNLDQQCGVINDKNLPCSRSLTCKSHSMGAKRAVQGRSRAYDELLIQWQREHNPNWVEPVKKETKAEKKEKKEKEKAEKKRLAEEAAIAAGLDPATAAKKAAIAASGGTNPAVKKQGKKAAAAAAAAVRIAEAIEKEEGPENLDDLDSEAEMDDMVASIRVARERGLIGVPLASPCDAGSWFVQRRERVRCCRDLLLGALGGSGLGGGLGLGSMAGQVNSLRSTSIVRME